MNFGHLLLLLMCPQQSSHLTMQQLLKSSSGSLLVQKISRQNYSIKMIIPLDGLHIMHHRNVTYKLHQVSILSFHYYEIRLALLICKFIWYNWIWNRTTVLNPGQTFDISDQPAYALTKELQFDHPEMFSQCFPIFKQLHIEQSLLIIHGQFAEGSELVRILTESKFSMIRLSAVADIKQLKESNIHIANYTICTFYQTSIWNRFVTIRLVYTKIEKWYIISVLEVCHWSGKKSFFVHPFYSWR